MAKKKTKSGRIIANPKQVSRKGTSVSQKDRDELAKSRAKGKGVSTQKMNTPAQSSPDNLSKITGKMDTGGDTIGMSKQELREKEIRNIAQKSLDIEKMKLEIQKENFAQEPQQTEQSVIPQETPKEEPQRADLTAKGILFGGEGGIFGDNEVSQGTLPIGLGGNVLKGAIKAGGLLTKTPKVTTMEKSIENMLNGINFKISPAIKAQRVEMAADKITFMSKGTFNHKQALHIVNSYNALTPAGKLKFLGKPAKAIGLGSLALLGYKIADTDTLTTWYALDNVLDGTKFMLPDAEEALLSGDMTPNEVINLINTADETIRLAKIKADKSSELNPFLWKDTKLIKRSTADKEAHWLLKKNNFFQKYGL